MSRRPIFLTNRNHIKNGDTEALTQTNSMDNQYTPIYTKLWHKEFLQLLIAEILLCTSCYMTIPFLPQLLSEHANANRHLATLPVLSFVAGMYLSGTLSSWLIQRYRRNKVYSFSAISFGLLLPCMLTIEKHSMPNMNGQLFLPMLTVVTTLAGAAFGLAKRILSCTLLTDKAESCHRTEANYAAITVARMAVAIGPILYFTTKHIMPMSWYYAIAAALTIIATLFVITIKFPFRAPEECTKMMSIDRFFLPQGWKVFIGILVCAIIFGYIMQTNSNVHFFIALFFGFLCATTTLRFPCMQNWKYMPTTGLLAFVASAILIMSMPLQLQANIIASAIIGFGLGIVCSFQLFHMLGLCQHCQRSTAESTYFLAADGGILIGIALANAYQASATIIVVALCCALIPLISINRKSTLRQK